MLAQNRNSLKIEDLCVVDCPSGNIPIAHQEGARAPTHKVVELIFSASKPYVELVELSKPETVTELAFRLLARSDQWEAFIGDWETTVDIDDSIRTGDLHYAAGEIVWVFMDKLDDNLAKVAIESRARFLEGKPVEDETHATRINKILDQLVDWQTALELLRMELPEEEVFTDERIANLCWIFVGCVVVLIIQALLAPPPIP